MYYENIANCHFKRFFRHFVSPFLYAPEGLTKSGQRAEAAPQPEID